MTSNCTSKSPCMAVLQEYTLGYILKQSKLVIIIKETTLQFQLMPIILGEINNELTQDIIQDTERMRPFIKPKGQVIGAGVKPYERCDGVSVDEHLYVQTTVESRTTVIKLAVHVICQHVLQSKTSCIQVEKLIISRMIKLINTF